MYQEACRGQGVGCAITKGQKSGTWAKKGNNGRQSSVAMHWWCVCKRDSCMHSLLGKRLHALALFPFLPFPPMFYPWVWPHFVPSWPLILGACFLSKPILVALPFQDPWLATWWWHRISDFLFSISRSRALGGHDQHHVTNSDIPALYFIISAGHAGSWALCGKIVRVVIAGQLRRGFNSMHPNVVVFCLLLLTVYSQTPPPMHHLTSSVVFVPVASCKSINEI